MNTPLPAVYAAVNRKTIGLAFITTVCIPHCIRSRISVTTMRDKSVGTLP